MQAQRQRNKPGKISELFGITNKIIGEIERWILTREKRPVHLSFKQLDQARLLKLRLWRERHYVEIPEILDLIMHILRDQVRRKIRPGGLGISVAAMTGTGAEKILEQEIKKKYPDNEHVTVFRERERERQLRAELEVDGLQVRAREIKSALQTGDIDGFAAAYVDRALRNRVKAQVELSSPRRQRKPYRGNVWR